MTSCERDENSAVFTFLRKGEEGRSETRGSGMERMFHLGSFTNSWVVTWTSVAPSRTLPGS